LIQLSHQEPRAEQWQLSRRDLLRLGAFAGAAVAGLATAEVVHPRHGPVAELPLEVRHVRSMCQMCTTEIGRAHV
jgi:thiosulfate reductase/polysulfide reductase chain A